MEDTMNLNKEIFNSDETLNLNEDVLKKLSSLFPAQVEILGTFYHIELKKFDEDPAFKRDHVDGYCSEPDKRIVVCIASTLPYEESESLAYYTNVMKQTLRHEIVHAYLNECGLMSCSYPCRGGWARNEEMVDWIANLGEKINRTWLETGCTVLAVIP